MEYCTAQTVAEAVSLLSEESLDIRVLAGGTDLLGQLRMGGARPQRIVDVKSIPELHSIEEDEEGFRVGAAVCGAEIGEHAGLRAHWPGVVEATELIGSTQIQGRASLGGNLCNASPAADTVPALIAAGATCSVIGPDGRRDVPVEDIVQAPGKTCLAPAEIVAHFRLPRRGPRSGDAYLRLIPRTEMDIAVVGAGVALTLGEDGRCTACRVGLGAVAPTALRVDEAAEALIGGVVDDAALEDLARAASAAARPIDDKRGTREYRIQVAGVLTRRAARVALERAEAMSS
ncbi:MAG: xanthine dehydrogenase family protein subunit M [Myxococcota bacterium]|nr:xanthine dehydrogenase family protein subunit M [Myxococcota bacterium]